MSVASLLHSAMRVYLLKVVVMLMMILVPLQSALSALCSFRAGNKRVSAQLLQHRALSGADAINALRPFYFAVHPDFFGQHPKEREVNENSLKRLNGYLESLQKPGGSSVQPTKLMFYVRETKENNDVQNDILATGFRSVSFTLQTRDVLSTVIDVLQSCSLSVEHMKALQANIESSRKTAKKLAGIPFYRPIKWDKTYYSFTGFRDPEQELEQARTVEPTLSMWLRNNETEASRKQRDSLPRRDELERLKRELCRQFAIDDIRWQRTWGLSHRCCQLQSLSRLSQQNPEAMLNLRGHTIIFTDQSGMNALGHVMLGTMDVHHQWAKVFERLPSYRSLKQQADWLKERISLLLGGIQVVHVERLGPLLAIEEHYSTLNAFHKRLLPRRLALHPRSLQGLSMTLESARSSPSLHELGHFLIPTACDPVLLQNFLQNQASEARRRIKLRNQMQAEEDEAVRSCLQTLSLLSLSKEPGVTSSQMIPCCHRLLELHSPLLQNLHLSISHFYSVMQDGDLCIPWDWKS